MIRGSRSISAATTRAAATRATAVARKQRGIPIHGWLVIDKPVGMTSMQVVSRVRRATGAAKAGHAGTLDPLASGVLPVALGEATKTVPFVTGGRKRYRFTLRWGEARSTDDAEGEVVATSAARPTPEQICAALERMVGDDRAGPAGLLGRSISRGSGPMRWHGPGTRSSRRRGR